MRNIDSQRGTARRAEPGHGLVAAGRDGAATRTLFRFYAPLAATAMLMMVTHNIVSGAVARTVDPVLALAAYSAAFSVGNVFESPCYRMQQMGLVFVRGKESFQAVSRASLIILAFLASFLLLLGYTPLSRVVFLDVLGTSPDVYRYAVMSLRVLVLWPISSTFRSVYQARIVLERQTLWMTVNMVIRVGVMLALAVLLPRWWAWGPVGAVILMAGLGTEALLAMMVARYRLPPLDPDPSDLPPVRASHALRFFVPLALAASVQTLGRPVLTAALARTAAPELALSGYHVMFSFAMILVVPIHSIYHVVLVFVRDRQSALRVRRFALVVGAAASALLALCALPAVGGLVFGTVIGVPGEVVGEALASLRFLVLMPLVVANGEFFADLLMLERRTVWVTAAKLANVLVMCTLAVAVAGLFPHAGSVAAALAMATGAVVEAGICYAVVRSVPGSRRYLHAREARAVAGVP